MADVAIILSSLFTRGSWGSTARSRDPASSLLDLRTSKQKNKDGEGARRPRGGARPNAPPGGDGEAPGRGAVHQRAEELLAGGRVAPQQGLVGEGLLDLERHPVVGVNHALGHALVHLQRLPGHQGRDVLVLVQLEPHLWGGDKGDSSVGVDVLGGGGALVGAPTSTPSSSSAPPRSRRARRCLATRVSVSRARLSSASLPSLSSGPSPASSGTWARSPSRSACASW